MTVYKCIYDTKDIHIGERRLLSINVAKLLNFSQVANKNLHFALQKFYKAKMQKRIRQENNVLFITPLHHRPHC